MQEGSPLLPRRYGGIALRKKIWNFERLILHSGTTYDDKYETDSGYAVGELALQDGNLSHIPLACMPI